MVNAISGTGSTELIATLVQQQSTAQSIDTAVLQKSQEIQKTQGEAAIKLIDSAANAGNTGGIDVRV